MQAIEWFANLSVADVASAGGKGANLGELTSAGLPVPPGFVITAEAYTTAMESSGTLEKLAAIRCDVDAHDSAGFARAGEMSASPIEAASIPPDLAALILEAYHRLGGGVRVAVRCSGTSERTGEACFAGMNASFTNVAGDGELLRRVVSCWASLYGAQSMAYRASARLTEEPTVAVVVQEMVACERSGIMLTADPRSGDTSRLVIEAVMGQSAAVVAGMVEPDTYVVTKSPLSVVDVRVGSQACQIVCGADGHDRELALDHGAARVLDDEQILDVARVGVAVGAHYGTPQETEWAMADGKVELVQCRPITTAVEFSSAGAA